MGNDYNDVHDEGLDEGARMDQNPSIISAERDMQWQFKPQEASILSMIARHGGFLQQHPAEFTELVARLKTEGAIATASELGQRLGIPGAAAVRAELADGSRTVAANLIDCS